MKSIFSPFQKLFVYERREMVVLGLLCFVMGLFAFTLGIHLGKEVGVRVEYKGDQGQKILAPLPDQIPTNQELTGPNKITTQALEESLNQTLHDEVVRTGIRLNPSFQTELPEESKTRNAGATTLKEASSHHEDGKHEVAENHETKTATTNHGEEASESGGRKISSVEEPPKSHAEKKSHSQNDPYSIQVGSFPNLREAEKKISELAALNLQPFVKEANLKRKGKWFRLFVGEYASIAAAEKAGHEYVAQHKIKSFIVSKIAD